ncbi:MAG: hypothetical protein K2G36_11285 [Ruminococcus sp.]|nr:hypothetical protein [Ruminococcus sp.]
MNISNVFFTMAQTAEVSKPTLFPFPLSLYLIFCIVATVFFVFRFVKDKSPYQIIMAVAIPLSLLIGYSDSKTIFYVVGAVEALLILSAFVSSIVCNRKKQSETPEEKSAETVEGE